MTFHIVTLFPQVIEPYLSSSIVGKAKRKGLIKVKYYNLTNFASNKHDRVDNRSYGGGPGMVIQVEPILKAISSIKLKNKDKTKVILFSPSGKQFSNQIAINLSQRYDHLILLCGRYEGFDERIKKILKDQKFQVDELSIGPYVLTGGELAAMVLVDAVSRQIKGVLGKEESLEEKRLGIGVPAYTRPETFIYRNRKYKVPKILLSGNHKEILSWRTKRRKK